MSLFVGSYSEEINQFILSENGNISFKGKSFVNLNPSWIEISSNGKFLFCVSEIDNYRNEFSGSVSSYSIEENGNLVLLNELLT